MRIRWVDAAKGLAILIVVLLHTPGVPNSLKSYVSTFIVHILFFLSGYVFPLSARRDLRGFVLSRARTLLVPYACLGLISMVAYAYVVSIGMAKGPVAWGTWLLELLLGRSNQITVNGPLWFLPTLFVVEVLYFRLRQRTERDVVLLGLAAALSLLGQVKFGTATRLPWSLDNGLYYLIFYCAGDVLQRRRLTAREAAVLAGIAGLGFALAYGLGYPTFIDFLWGYASRIAVAFAGIAVAGGAAHVLVRSRILQFYGANTVAVLGLHIGIGLNLARVIVHFGRFNLGASYGEAAFFYLFFTLASAAVGAVILNRLAPFVVGKRYPPTRPQAAVAVPRR